MPVAARVSGVIKTTAVVGDYTRGRGVHRRFCVLGTAPTSLLETMSALEGVLIKVATEALAVARWDDIYTGVRPIIGLIGQSTL